MAGNDGQVAVVYDSDLSINYDHGKPLGVNGNLQGETYGILAFKVIGTFTNDLFSSSTLPDVQIQILDASEVCNIFQIFRAPVPESSSIPNDRIAPGSPDGYHEVPLPPLFVP